MNAVTRILLVVAATLVLPGSVALWPCTAAACTCYYPSPAEAHRASDLVIWGQVIDGTRLDAPDRGPFKGFERARVQVSRIVKGPRPPGAGQGLRIATPADEAGGYVSEEGIDICHCGPPGIPDDAELVKFYLKASDRFPGRFVIYAIGWAETDPDPVTANQVGPIPPKRL